MLAYQYKTLCAIMWYKSCDPMPCLTALWKYQEEEQHLSTIQLYNTTWHYCFYNSNLYRDCVTVCLIWSLIWIQALMHCAHKCIHKHGADKISVLEHSHKTSIIDMHASWCCDVCAAFVKVYTKSSYTTVEFSRFLQLGSHFLNANS